MATPSSSFSFHVFFRFLFYVYEDFACMYLCVSSCATLVLQMKCMSAVRARAAAVPESSVWP